MSGRKWWMVMWSLHDFPSKITVLLSLTAYNISFDNRAEGEREAWTLRWPQRVCVCWQFHSANHFRLISLYNFTFSFVELAYRSALIENLSSSSSLLLVLQTSDVQLTKSHVEAWKTFWQSFQVDIEGDDAMVMRFSFYFYGSHVRCSKSWIISRRRKKQQRSVISSIFYLTSSLPSRPTAAPLHPFYGLSPTGLGRGGSIDDYEGHNFWDTPIFMMPPIAVIDPRWANDLLHYRFMMLDAARSYANSSGFRGSRWVGAEIDEKASIKHKQHRKRSWSLKWKSIKINYQFIFSLSLDIFFVCFAAVGSIHTLKNISKISMGKCSDWPRDDPVGLRIYREISTACIGRHFVWRAILSRAHSRCRFHDEWRLRAGARDCRVLVESCRAQCVDRRVWDKSHYGSRRRSSQREQQHLHECHCQIFAEFWPVSSHSHRRRSHIKVSRVCRQSF